MFRHPETEIRQGIDRLPHGDPLWMVKNFLSKTAFKSKNKGQPIWEYLLEIIIDLRAVFVQNSFSIHTNM